MITIDNYDALCYLTYTIFQLYLYNSIGVLVHVDPRGLNLEHLILPISKPTIKMINKHTYFSHNTSTGYYNIISYLLLLIIVLVGAEWHELARLYLQPEI